MITLFSCPKPFKENIRTIQRNAIRSWRLLGPSVEIILFGDEEGTAEAAAEFGARHIPSVEQNEYGTPLLSDIFEKAQKIARNNLVCYINADIILFHDYIETVSFISKRNKKFLLIGQRWDVEISSELEFRDQWEENLKSYVIKNGKLSARNAIDFFVFPKGSIEYMPPFAIGRPAWDNWFIYNALSNYFPVIEGTATIMPIHQNHSYNHVKHGTGIAWEGPEANRNRMLAGGRNQIYTLDNANFILTKKFVVKAAWKNRLITFFRDITKDILRVIDKQF